ncbi:MAG TPA: SDR family oxidoreductase [Armatimonadota bacterium]|nr:SDR family oxidoreductase [Armatimonadota bacterium]
MAKESTDQFAESIEGRTAVIIGAAGGIGGAIAARLGAAGARLALVDLSAAAVRKSGTDGLVIQADITDRSQVDEAARRVREALGGADILVNAAGINTKQRTLEDMSPEQWERVIGVDLTGVFHCTQAFLGMMRERGGGIVVTIVSAAALAATAGAGAHYCAAKRALLSLTESINVEHARHGIRACAVCPGEVDTPLVDMRPDPPSAERRAAALKPEDVAEAVYFAVTRPPRVTVSEIVVYPSAQLSGTYEI